MPFTYICFIIGSLSIMGFPYLTGFFSKELIIELSLKRYIIDSNFCYIISIFSSIFTIIYSFKLLVYTFFITSVNSFLYNYKLFYYLIIDSLDNMFISMFILAILSIFIGYTFSDIIIGLGTPIWNNSLLILPYHDNLLIFSSLLIFIKDLPLIFTIIGIFYIWGFLKLINKDIINNNLFKISTDNYYKFVFYYIIDYYYYLCNIGYMLFFLIIYIIIYLYHLINYFI